MDAIRTENWHRYKSFDGEPPSLYISRVRSELQQLENLCRVQWTSRVPWRTHTAPSGCWICDAFGVIHGLLAYMEECFPDEDKGEQEPSNRLSGSTDVKVQKQETSPQ